MSNILDYVSWRSDLSFNESKFNIIDGLVFSQLIFMDMFDNVSSYPSNEIKRLEDVFDGIFKDKTVKDISLGLILSNDIVKMAYNIKSTNRYKDVYMSNNVNIIDKSNTCQFSAICFHINENDIVISFSGTDDTLIGWQENLNMLTTFPIPSQNLARKYVNKIMKLFPSNNIYIVGHSKGGNLAAYSAIYCKDENKEKIKEVYCFDSPGFEKEHIDENKYGLVKDKITLVLPKSSVIGMVFEPFAGNKIVCDSNYKGLKQHDAFSWQIKANKFVILNDVTSNSRKFDKTLKSILNNLTKQQTDELAKNIYDFIIELNKNTLVELQKDPITFVKQLHKITPYNRKLFMGLVVNLLKYKLL